jgi:hypothetical protein
MKVVLEAGTGAMLKGKVKDKDGKETEVELASVSVEPFFTTETGPAPVVLGKSLTKGGKAVDSFMLSASGTTGKITRQARPVASAKGVIPKIDAVKKVEEKKPDA